MIERGKYHGGYTIFPQYCVAIDLRNTDFVAMDVHQWHCNTPLVGDGEKFRRYSLVMYYRDNMIKCGTSEENLEYAKNRQLGDPIYEN